MPWNIPGLFVENVHSKWQISRSPLRGPEFEALQSMMQPILGRQFLSAERINEGLTSVNFRIECLMPSGEVELVHLRMDKRNSREAVERIARLTEFIYRDLNISVFDLEGKTWQYGKFIEGNHFRGRIAELMNAAGAVASVEQRLHAYGEASAFPQQSFGTMDISVWHKAAEEMPESRTRALYREQCERLIALSITTEDAVKKHQGPLSRIQLVHGDIHPQNLIMDGSRVAAIIDFGNASIGTLGMDLGMACHRLVRQYMVCRNLEHGERWENSLPIGLRVFLEAYQDAMPGVTQEHLRDTPTFMREILLRKIGYNLTMFAWNKRADDMASSQIERFIGLLDEVDQMDEFFAW